MNVIRFIQYLGITLLMGCSVGLVFTIIFMLIFRLVMFEALFGVIFCVSFGTIGYVMINFKEEKIIEKL
jgi:hypothetical protein